jgi:Mce-associated membrane protein
MSDTTPDPREGAASGSGSGARRSGLDRLRATKGGPASETQSSTAGGSSGASPSAATGSAVSSGSGDHPRRTGEGTTALLEPPTAGSSATALAPEQTAPAGAEGLEPTPDRKSGKRSRKRGRPGAAAGGARGVPTPPAEDVAPAPRWQKALAAALAVLAVALLVLVVIKRNNLVPTKSERAATALANKRDAALSAGRQFAVTFFSPDYKKVDDYNNQVMALTTGDFNKDFAGKRGELKSVLGQVQSQATGKILTAGVSRVSGDTVEVLLVVDQDVKNKASKGKVVTNRYRVQLTLQQTPKGWLVNALAPVV